MGQAATAEALHSWREDAPRPDGRPVDLFPADPPVVENWSWIIRCFRRRIQKHVALSDHEIAQLLGIGARESLFTRHSDLLVGGGELKQLYFIRDGWAASYMMLPDGRRQITHFLLPGDVVGFLDLLDGRQQFSVSALERVRVFAVPASRIRSTIELHPRLALALQWVSVDGMVDLRRQVVRLGRQCAYSRIAHLIVELFERHKFLGLASGTGFRWPITQETLADALGLTTVHVNRTLRRIEEDGLVARRGDRLIIRDLERLAEAADYHPMHA